MTSYPLDEDDVLLCFLQEGTWEHFRCKQRIYLRDKKRKWQWELDNLWPTYYGSDNRLIPYGMREYWPNQEVKPIISQVNEPEPHVSYPRTGDWVESGDQTGYIVWISKDKVAVRNPGKDAFPSILDKEHFKVYSSRGSRTTWHL